MKHDTAEGRSVVSINHPHSFLRSCFLLLVVCLAAPVTLAASNPAAWTRTERAKRAEDQMKVYRQRLAERRYLQKPTIATFPQPAKESRSLRSAASSAVFYFQDNCESGTNGWTVDPHTDTAAWHLTTKDANTPTHSWWAGSEQLGTYDVGTRVHEALVSAPIDLSLVSGAVTLLFSENYFTEAGWDFCMVDVSTNGGSTWSNLRGGYGDAPSGDSHGWIVSTLDLTPYAGNVITLRFLFDTGDSLYNSFPGWFVDNVYLFDQYGSIQGMVYYDQNQNGTYDLAEAGLNDWLVAIDGPISLMASTKYAGIYQVPLPLGSYTVAAVQQYPWQQTSTPAPWNVTLSTQGELITPVSFGEYRQGCVLQGLVFRDENKDSVYENGEPPLSGSWIDLIDSNDVTESVQSDTAGQFSFVVITPGTFSVVQYLYFADSEWVSTIPGGNPPTYQVSVPNRDTVIGGLLFGNYPVPPAPATASISGYVFNDLNQDSLQDIREPMLAGMEIVLMGPGGNQSFMTDTTGRFSFQNLPAGIYYVRMQQMYRWRQSVPASLDPAYSIALSSGQTKDSVVFGAYELPVGTIGGTLFNDLNRNGVRDSLEPALAGWEVNIIGSNSWGVSSLTDSAGRFLIDTVVAGSNTVTVSLPAHWQLSPPASYPVTLGPLQVVDTLAIGAFALSPGSIGGTLFDDVNGNMVRDSGEGGVAGKQVYLAGWGTTTTDDSGHYRFDGLWPNSYQVRLVMTSRWRQTFPALLQPQMLTLGSEENRNNVDFGAKYDSTFNLAYRSFLPESIAFARDNRGKLRYHVLRKPNASEATFDLVVPAGGLNGLHLEFSQLIYPASFTAGRFPSISYDVYQTRWDLGLNLGDTLVTGEHITIFARGNKGKTLFIRKYWWKSPTSSPALNTTAGRNLYGSGRLLLPLPNAVNMLEEMYLLAFGGSAKPGLTVGIYGPHSVYHMTAKDVLKSLVDIHGLHLGPPRCLGVYANTLSQIIRPSRALTPTRGNNILFAEALTMKVNILASDAGITPYGFGDLIFSGDPGNPWNGYSVRKIAAKIDTALSAFNPTTVSCVYSTSFFDTAYATIRSIDSVFCGTFDTLSFYNALTLTPVKDISQVPFLHIDSSFSAIAMAARRPASPSALPEKYILAQNYPNPFNPTTTIEFYLLSPGIVTLTMYNTLGQEVARPIDRQYMDEGWGDVEFTADSYKLSSGVYFYQLKVEQAGESANGAGFTSTKKMVLIK